jgi:hypothetical protein
MSVDWNDEDQAAASYAAEQGMKRMQEEKPYYLLFAEKQRLEFRLLDMSKELRAAQTTAVVEREVIEQLRQRLVKAEAERDAAITEIEALGRRVGEVEAERDTLREQLVAMESDADMNNLPNAGVALIDAMLGDTLRAERTLAALREPSEAVLVAAATSLRVAPAPLYLAEAVAVVLRSAVAAAEREDV